MKFEIGKYVVSAKGGWFVVEKIDQSKRVYASGKKIIEDYIIVKSCGPKYLKRNGEGKEFLANYYFNEDNVGNTCYRHFGIDKDGNEFAELVCGAKSLIVTARENRE